MYGDDPAHGDYQFGSVTGPTKETWSRDMHEASHLRIETSVPHSGTRVAGESSIEPEGARRPPAKRRASSAMG